MQVNDMAADVYDLICNHEGLTADQIAVKMKLARDDVDALLAHLTTSLGNQTLVYESNGVYRRFVKPSGKRNPNDLANSTAHRCSKYSKRGG